MRVDLPGAGAEDIGKGREKKSDFLFGSQFLCQIVRRRSPCGGARREEGRLWSSFASLFSSPSTKLQDGEPRDARPHRAPVPGEEEVSLMEGKDVFSSISESD